MDGVRNDGDFEAEVLSRLGGENPIIPSDQERITEAKRALATAKGLLTRRTRAFNALLAHPYTYQHLVDARGDQVRACENMAAAMTECERAGITRRDGALNDGIHRQEECMGHYRAIYEERLADFVDQDSHRNISRMNGSNQNPPSVATSEASQRRRTELARQQERAARDLRREQRARARAEEERLDAELQRIALNAQAEEQTARRAAELQVQSRLDREERELDDLRDLHLQAQDQLELEITESVRGGSARRSQSSMTRPASQFPNQPSCPPLGAPSVVQSQNGMPLGPLLPPAAQIHPPVFHPATNPLQIPRHQMNHTPRFVAPYQVRLPAQIGPRPASAHGATSQAGANDMPLPLIPEISAATGPDPFALSNLRRSRSPSKSPARTAHSVRSSTPCVRGTKKGLPTPNINDDPPSPSLQHHARAVQLERERNTELRARLDLEERQLTIEARRLQLEKDRAAIEASKASAAQRKISIEKDPVSTRKAPPGYGNATMQTSIVGRTSYLPDRYLALPYSSDLGPLAPNVVPTGNPLPQTTTTPSQLASSNLQNDYIGAMLLQSLVPKREPFSGNPSEYQVFILDYEQVACRLQSNPRWCLQVLRGMLAGDALESIKRYLAEPDPEVALREALSTLERSYGTIEKQCRTQLATLLDLPPVKDTEAGLLRFEGQLDTCNRIMRRCNRLNDLDSVQVLKCMFKKLPERLKSKWDKEVLKTTSRMPTFEILLKVIKEAHSSKTSEMNHWREEIKSHERNTPKQNRKGSTKINNFQTDDISQNQNLVAQLTETPPPDHSTSDLPLNANINAVTLGPKGGCLCGPQGRHKCIADCPVYQQAQGIPAKWALVWNTEGFCYRCLHSGHDARKCSFGVCGKDGCDRLHHITLHKPEHVDPKPRKSFSSGQRSNGPQRQVKDSRQFYNSNQGLNPQAPAYRQQQAASAEYADATQPAHS